MNKKQELTHMRDSLRKSKVIEGMAITPARERMLERELTVVRIVGGYKGHSPANVQSSSLVAERFQSRGVPYKPTGGRELSTYVVDVGNGCKLLPEAVGEDGLIHVQSEHGMNLGILVARAKSPILDQEGHTTREVLLDYDCMVNDMPLVYEESARASDDFPLASRSIEGAAEKAKALIFRGENTFLDVLPGRVRMEGDDITGFTEMLSDKSKGYTGKPDLVLVFKGAVLPAEEEIDAPKQLPEPTARSRGISLGDTADVRYRLESREFNASRNQKDTYKLEFVFD